MRKKGKYLIVIGFNFLAFFLAYLKDLIVANKFGVSVVTDQYFLFLAIINTLFLVAGGNSFKVILVPFFNKHNTIHFGKISRKIMKYIFLVVIIILPLYFIAVTVMSGENNAQKSELYNLWVLGIAYIILNSINMYIESIFYYKKRYINNTLGPIITNSTFVVLCIIFYNQLDLYSLILIFVLSFFIRWIIFTMQYYVLIKGSKGDDEESQALNLKEFLIKVIPITIAALAIKLNFMVDNYFATKIETGAIAGLNYANRIYQLPIGLLSFSILSILFSNLSSNYFNNRRLYMENVKRYFLVLLTLSFPLSLILYQYSTEIIDFIFGRGNFNQDALVITNEALVGYSIGLSMTVLNLYLVKVIQSQGNTRYPSMVSLISIAYNFFLTFILYKEYGLFGITISTSITLALNNLLLVYKIKYALNIKLFLISIIIIILYLSAFLFFITFESNLFIVISILVLLSIVIIYLIEKWRFLIEDTNYNS